MKKSLFLVAVLSMFLMTAGNAQAWFAADPRTTEGAANVKIPVFNNGSSSIAAGNVVALDADASTGDNDLYVALEDANDTSIVIGVVWPDAISAGSAGSVVVYGFAECDIDGAGVDENGLICTSNSGSGGLGKTCSTNSAAYAMATVDNAGSTQTTCFVLGR